MKEQKFAVLIDSDNISPRYLKTIMDEITNVGVPTFKRIYGDWTTAEKQGWKKLLLEYALTPMQQYSYTSGKNSSDSAMIIDAMDILYTGDVDGFCLASSDSDFTKLATRLREAGKIVIGMGERKTPVAFKMACSQFKYLDTLTDKAKTVQKPDKTKKPATKTDKSEPVKTEQAKAVAKQEQPKATEKENAVAKSTETSKKRRNKNKSKEKADVKPLEEVAETAQSPVGKTESVVEQIAEPVADPATEKENVEDSVTPLEEIAQAIQQIIDDSNEESGLIPASRVGYILQNRYPDFDTRNYGCRRMTDLLKLLNIPTESFNDTNNPLQNTTILYIKSK